MNLKFDTAHWIWFYHEAIGTIIFGSLIALLLSKYSKISLNSKKNIAWIFGFLFSLPALCWGLFAGGAYGGNEIVDLGVMAAFGLAFSIGNLRWIRWQSLPPMGWIAMVFNLIGLYYIIESVANYRFNIYPTLPHPASA